MEIPLNGFLLIDKPAGISSFDVIRQLRRQTGIKTWGHAGTLDPFATGLLIIAVNKYTRLLPLLDDADKTYAAVMQFGTATTTADPEGDICATDDKAIARDEVSAIISDILAITEMQPPRYSALKVAGKRAYELARKGESFELPARAMNIMSFAISDFSFPLLSYHVQVSKGTYIRALSEWIASRLETVAYTTCLRRTAINNVSVSQATALDAVNAENLRELLKSVETICPDLAQVSLETADLAKLRNGNPALNPGTDEDILIVLGTDAACYGIAYRRDGVLYPKVNI